MFRLLAFELRKRNFEFLETTLDLYFDQHVNKVMVIGHPHLNKRLSSIRFTSSREAI